MSARGKYNIGELSRQAFGSQSYHIGFGTDHGTVAAASSWDGPMEVRPSGLLIHKATSGCFTLQISQDCCGGGANGRKNWRRS